ncbi:condensation domain-containing protein [Streptomyces sp. NPDC052299]|uniref:condensation domain-containing protein n=1 Tax=Streptomyces sp. NPDC052299 TaxID=3155054 RepID=UPI00342D2B7D
MPASTGPHAVVPLAAAVAAEGVAAGDPGRPERGGDVAGRGLPEIRAAVAAALAGVTGLPADDVPWDTGLTALGVTSLEIGRICARLGDALGRPVPISQIYRQRTAAGLAEWIHATDGRPHAAPGGGTEAGDDTRAPLSPTQTFMFMKHVFKPDDLSLHSVRCWRIEGRPDRAALAAAVEYLHRRHRYLSAEYLFQEQPYVRPADLPAPPLGAFLADTEEDARDVLARELAKPFRLVRGDVWRPVFVAVRQAHVTLFGYAVHHVAFDGGSSEVLAHDLSAAYNAYAEGRTPDLEPAPGPREVAEALEAHLPYVDLDAQREYWRRTINGMTPLEYPGGAEAPRGTPCRMTDLPLPAGLADGVRGLAQRHGVSPFAVYLSAYGQAMAELIGEHDFGVGTPVNRRGNSVLSRAAGCLIDILPLRPRTDPDASPAASIAATAAAVAEAFSAQDLSISEIAGLQLKTESTDRNRMFQTMFVLQDNGLGELALKGLPSQFFRPRYPGVSGEVHAEVWPAAGKHGRLVIGYHPDRTSGAFCDRLAAAMLDRLSGYLA